MHNRSEEHAFSIEMKSREYVRRISMSDKTQDPVLIEGFLGEFEEIGFVEGSLLEVRGAYGVLRIDLKEEDLRRVLKGGLTKESLR